MTEIPRARLEEFLKIIDGRYVIAKNPDVWSSLERGGDWDLMVDDVCEVRSALWHTLGYPKRWVDRGYVDSSFYHWGSVDLLPALTWRGSLLLSFERAQSRCRNFSGLSIACPAHQAIAGWVLPVLATTAYKSRYDAVVEKAISEDLEELNNALAPLGGIANAQALLSTRKGRTRARFLYTVHSFVVNPPAHGRRLTKFIKGEARARLRPSLPLLATTNGNEADQFVAWVAIQGPAYGRLIEIPLLKPADRGYRALGAELVAVMKAQDLRSRGVLPILRCSNASALTRLLLKAMGSLKVSSAQMVFATRKRADQSVKPMQGPPPGRLDDNRKLRSFGRGAARTDHEP